MGKRGEITDHRGSTSQTRRPPSSVSISTFTSTTSSPAFETNLYDLTNTPAGFLDIFDNLNRGKTPCGQSTSLHRPLAFPSLPPTSHELTFQREFFPSRPATLYSPRSTFHSTLLAACDFLHRPSRGEFFTLKETSSFFVHLPLPTLHPAHWPPSSSFALFFLFAKTVESALIISVLLSFTSQLTTSTPSFSLEENPSSRSTSPSSPLPRTSEDSEHDESAALLAVPGGGASGGGETAEHALRAASDRAIVSSVQRMRRRKGRVRASILNLLVRASSLTFSRFLFPFVS